MKRTLDFVLVAGILLMLVRMYNAGGLPLVGPAEVDRVTYVFDEDTTGAAPAPVAVALGKLNQQGIVALEFDKDTTDGDGETPEQFQVAVEAAADIPALVVQAGSNVVRVVKAPQTEAEVMEAAK